TGRLGGFMAHSSRQRTRLSALGITRWRHRGTPLKEEEPAEASVNVSAEAQAVATANLAPEPRPAAPEAPASSVPTPATAPAPEPEPGATASPPCFTFECVVLEDHLLLADRTAFQDGQGARAQLAEAADALRVLYLQSHGMLPKAKAQRHQFVWPQVADGGLDQGQGAAEAALLGYVGRVLADKGRLLVLTPAVPGEAVTAQLSALERQLPQARLCRGIMPELQADPAAPRQALWTQLLSRP
ncbi:MAG: hypothetical protein VXX81_09575, partial [Pseudomonadota bacterium]|nr:hypothetical protein [Pseudomonadota bacterium]